jgi:hypothetical protein
MVIGHKVIHNPNHSFFIVAQAVLPAIAMSVKHNCDKSCAVRCGNNASSFVAERRHDGSRADLSPGMDIGGGPRRGATLERVGWGRFQSSLRDESDCRCRIHGMNPVATIKASLRDALLHACRKVILRYNACRLWRKTSRQTKTA